MSSSSSTFPSLFSFSPHHPQKVFDTTIRWNFSSEFASKERKEKQKSTSLLTSSAYIPLSLYLINPSTHRRPFFPKFIPTLMDILSTGGFWFSLLMLSASPNIHFGCSAPSHWFLWRWNCDWTDLSWRPRDPARDLHCDSIKDADAPYYYLPGKWWKGIAAPYDLHSERTLLCQIWTELVTVEMKHTET